jgi:hypothetical protein
MRLAYQFSCFGSMVLQFVSTAPLSCAISVTYKTRKDRDAPTSAGQRRISVVSDTVKVKSLSLTKHNFTKMYWTVKV